MVEIKIDVSVKVTCGYDHTLALTNKGEIYAWGNNDEGQIGVNTWQIHRTSNLFDPIMVSYGFFL